MKNLTLTPFMPEPLGTPPDQFGSLLKNEMIRWAKLVQSTGIKVD